MIRTPLRRSTSAPPPSSSTTFTFATKARQAGSVDGRRARIGADLVENGIDFGQARLGDRHEIVAGVERSSSSNLKVNGTYFSVLADGNARK